MNTPLLYSIVPIAPSNTTMRCGSSRASSVTRVMCGAVPRCSVNVSLRICVLERRATPDLSYLLVDALGRADHAAHGVVFRLRMVHDDRRRALLRHQLMSARELHPELLSGWQQLEHD